MTLKNKPLIHLQYTARPFVTFIKLAFLFVTAICYRAALDEKLRPFIAARVGYDYRAVITVFFLTAFAVFYMEAVNYYSSGRIYLLKSIGFSKREIDGLFLLQNAFVPLVFAVMSMVTVYGTEPPVAMALTAVYTGGLLCMPHSLAKKTLRRHARRRKSRLLPKTKLLAYWHKDLLMLAKRSGFIVGGVMVALIFILALSTPPDDGASGLIFPCYLVVYCSVLCAQDVYSVDLEHYYIRPVLK